MEKTERKIEFDASKILKCIRHIAHVNNTVTKIYHLAKDCSVNTVTPLETDGLAFVFPDEKGEVKVTSEIISDWIFRKAFEDIIIGLTESLIEIHRLLNIYSIAKESEVTPFENQEIMEETMRAIAIKPSKLPLPVLMKEIEIIINEPLQYRGEISSINQVRNCLVHRNSIVSLADINDPNSKLLCLSYIDLVIFMQTGGNIIELTKEVKNHSPYVENLLCQYIQKKISFSLNEKVVINADIFKGATNTCILFIQELIRKLPISDTIKNSIIQPYQMNLCAENIH